MAVLDIVLYPDKRLRERCEEVTVFDEKLKKIVMDMAETMYVKDGVGLAAVQVGIMKRIVVCDVNPPEEQGQEDSLLVLINPVILERKGEIEWEEGCLSIPGINEVVKRSKWVKVEALDLEGKKFVIEGEDLLSVCLQHEIDHLNGVLFIDHLSAFTRKLALSKYKKLMKEKNGKKD